MPTFYKEILYKEVGTLAGISVRISAKGKKRGSKKEMKVDFFTSFEHSLFLSSLGVVFLTPTIAINNKLTV